ncbi:inositol-1-monophosphatase [Mycobacteroides abscessus subsp. massiliense]|uniref:inositol monophosphatase family protein n=1 Tax=Mycobacteroides abscessus TaxID=36809 RepID=UPI0009A7965C|nr:inositol monophosphatase family protein [Mycobacteroides abscessus]SKU49540.1 inositol-1-monophosphatase [Mycobacteroides abscessus subsp. massiliense]SKV03484.1 inositol-1-monophosphatase [Mycobacteroides abscessus subsp. massiliense]
MNHHDMLEIALKATELGSNLLESARPESVVHKSDRDLVTDVDLRIQRDITDYLATATPNIGLLGEENAHHVDIAATKCLWVLDPIDGTSNFVHGLPLCSVSLALLQHGTPVVAVTQAPFLCRTYHAAQGDGAYLNGDPITASGTNRLDEAIVSLGDYATGPDADDRNRYRLTLTGELVTRVERIRMFGAATLDLAFVAEGVTDACIIMSNKPWDTAAGTLLAAEAGASVTDAHGNNHNHLSTSTVAAAPRIASQLASIIETTA